MSKSEKAMQAALGKLKDDLTHRYGDKSIMFANEVPIRPAISSGSLALDYAMGIGGLPPDRIIEVAGAEGCGKTTLGLLAMASFLDAQPDRGALILDTEHKLTMEWVEQLLGAARMHRVLLAWPDHMEQASDIYTDLVQTGKICFVLFDSIGGTPTKAATQKSAEIGVIGGNAGAVSRFARLAATYTQKHESLLFGVNQVRADMEGFHRHVTPGGFAWHHHCIARLLLRRSTRETVEAKVNGEEMQIGFKVVAKVVKNQLAPQGRTANWWMYNVPTEKYGPIGIDTLDEVVRLGILTKVIEQAGAFYNHSALPGTKVQGREKLIAAVREDDSLKKTIVSEVMARLKEDESLVAEVAPMDPEQEHFE